MDKMEIVRIAKTGNSSTFAKTGNSSTFAKTGNSSNLQKREIVRICKNNKLFEFAK